MGDQFFRTRKVIIVIAIGVPLLLGVFLALQFAGKASIDTYEECVAAGNPVMESYPQQCRANGQLFANPAQVSQ